MSNSSKVKANCRKTLLTKLNKRDGFKESGIEIPTEIDKRESGYYHILELISKYDNSQGRVICRGNIIKMNRNAFEKFDKKGTLSYLQNDNFGQSMHIIHNPTKEIEEVVVEEKESK